MWNRKDLKEQAKVAVKRNYWKTVLVGILATCLMTGSTTAGGHEVSDTADSLAALGQMDIGLLIGSVIGVLALILLVTFFLEGLVFGPLQIGISKFKLEALKGEGKLITLSYAYHNNYKNNAITMFKRTLFIDLWSFLFVIPGIVKYYEYRMIPYLLAEYPGMDSREAFAKSKEMMMGNKWNTFVLDLSFLPWDILATVTLGIVGVFYVTPYRQMTDAALYEELKKNG